jgi:hypothetical protein
LIGIDGVPFFKQKSCSMFLIGAMNVNFPPNERFKLENFLILGIWVGKFQPDMNMYLEPLLSQLKSLGNEGKKQHIYFLKIIFE